jgi:polo-like kinase 1
MVETAPQTQRNQTERGKAEFLNTDRAASRPSSGSKPGFKREPVEAKTDRPVKQPPMKTASSSSYNPNLEEAKIGKSN